MLAAGGRRPDAAGVACGDYAVNTTQPPYQPYAPGTAPARRLPPQTAPTIGDRLSAQGHRLGLVLGWLVQRGRRRQARPGWTNGTARTTCTDPDTAAGAVVPELPGQAVPVPPPAVQLLRLVRARHRRARAAPARRAGVPLRGRGSDESCRLKPVSFIKPLGAENEHPGYASEHTGSDHLVDLLKVDRGRAAAPRTRWSSSPTTSSAASGTTSRRPARAAPPGPHDELGPRHAHPGARRLAAAAQRRSSSTTRSTTRRRSWRRSSSASASSRSRRATPTCRTSVACSAIASGTRGTGAATTRTGTSRSTVPSALLGPTNSSRIATDSRRATEMVSRFIRRHRAPMGRTPTEESEDVIGLVAELVLRIDVLLAGRGADAVYAAPPVGVDQSAQELPGAPARRSRAANPRARCVSVLHAAAVLRE